MSKALLRAALTTSVLAFLTIAATEPAARASDKQWVPTPLMRTVSPDVVKPGDVVTVAGDYLDKTRVAEVYLTDGKNNTKVEVLEQTASEIKFKVPENAKPARLRLMVLTTGAEPQYLEQPVMVTIQ